MKQRRGHVPPTLLRRFVDPRSHMPPRSMVDHAGNPWRGTSRVIDRPARRRKEQRSWRRELATARRAFVAEQSEAE